MKKLTLFLLFISQFSYAQSDLVTSALNQIPFTADTIQSVFMWVTDKVAYDVKAANKMKNTPPKERLVSYQSPEEKRKFHLTNTLKHKKGICEDYSALFDTLVKALGYEAYVVDGYTKNSKGNLVRSIGHSWNVVKVNGYWKLYEPTWGAGSVRDGKRFIKKYNPKWFDVSPEEMIKTHLPFDPIWQLLPPITYQNFQNNSAVISPEKNYDPNKLIAAYSQLDRKSKMESELQRSLAMGEGTSLLKRWRKELKENIARHGINSKVNELNAANDTFGQSVKLFNGFIEAQKKQFKGEKYSISNIKTNLEEAKIKAQSAMKVFQNVKLEDRKSKKSIDHAIKTTQNLLSQINRALAFIAKKK